MKNSIISVVLLVSSYLGNAQNVLPPTLKKQKYSFGVILLSEQSSSLPGAEQSLLNGIVTKYLTNKFTYRLAFEHANLVDLEDKDICCDQMVSVGSGKQNLIRFGIQRQIKDYKILSPYIGVDFVGIASKMQRSFAGGNFPLYYKMNSTAIAFGATSVFGLQCIISRRISASLETRFGIARWHSKYTILEPNPWPQLNPYRESITSGLNRFSCLSLDYKF
jgi:hypothetical protein